MYEMISTILGRALQSSAILTFIKVYRTKLWNWLSSCLKTMEYDFSGLWYILWFLVIRFAIDMELKLVFRGPRTTKICLSIWLHLELKATFQNRNV